MRLYAARSTEVQIEMQKIKEGKTNIQNKKKHTKNNEIMN